MEQSEDEVVKLLFVDVFKDKSSFIDAYTQKLDKTDAVEKEMRTRRPMRINRGLLISEDSVVGTAIENLNLDNNNIIKNIVNFFKDKELTTTTRVSKVFTKSSPNEATWTVGIAHAKLKKDPLMKTIPVRLEGHQDTQQFTKYATSPSPQAGSQPLAGPGCHHSSCLHTTQLVVTQPGGQGQPQGDVQCLQLLHKKR